MASRADLRYTDGMNTKTLGGLLTSIALAASVQAATQTYVALAGRDDAIPKLGRPGITVGVDAMTQADAIAVSNEVNGELARVVHTRPLDPGEAGDYRLAVQLDAASKDGAVSTIPFTATLASAQGERLWRIEGRAETTDSAVDPSVLASIGRNVVSALLHDGWVMQRFDPNDPPPPPPRIRKDDPAD